MVKATLRDGRSTILFEVLSLLPQLLLFVYYFSWFLIGLCEMKICWLPLISEETFAQLVPQNERC